MEFSWFGDGCDGEAFGGCWEHEMDENVMYELLGGVDPCGVNSCQDVESESFMSRCTRYTFNTWAQLRDENCGGGGGGEAPGP